MKSDDELSYKILDWLNRQGYPLEMPVTSAFRNAGFSARQSCFYDDPETAVPREIDVIATMPEDLSLIHERDVSFVVECKVTREKPWILFTGEDVLAGWNIFFTRAVLTESARNTLLETIRGKGSWKLRQPELRWLWEDIRAGYGLTQAFTSGRDIVHEAVMSVSKAALARKAEMERRSGRLFEVISPIIVVDGRLFECFLDDICNVQIREVQEGVLFQPRKVGEELLPCIRIVTLNSLQQFTQRSFEISKVIVSSRAGIEDDKGQ